MPVYFVRRRGSGSSLIERPTVAEAVDAELLADVIRSHRTAQRIRATLCAVGKPHNGRRKLRPCVTWNVRPDGHIYIDALGSGVDDATLALLTKLGATLMSQRRGAVMSASNETLLRLPELRARVGLSRSTIYRLMSAGQFPTALKLSPQTIAWRQSEVDAWVSSRPRVGVQS